MEERAVKQDLSFIDSLTDAVILLWKVNDNKEPEQTAFQEEAEAELNKENWTVVKTLR